MKDPIERADAIKAAEKLLEAEHGIWERVVIEDAVTALCGYLMDLPAAQPEIIRCKDCKHWREGTTFSYCDKLYGMGVLDALDYMVAEDDYCSMAERREE